MTTILADHHLGLMVSDSNISDGTRRWSTRKVFRVAGGLVGHAGEDPDFENFRAWIRSGMKKPPDFWFEESVGLVLNAHGLFYFDVHEPRLKRVASGREAIGTGAVGAMCAYQALRWTDPKRAVRIACEHDDGSRPPVRAYYLKGNPCLTKD